MWIRSRFKTDQEDFRPVKFPPPGPYWCSGYGKVHFTSDDGYAVVIAYTQTPEQVKEYWPDAWSIESIEENEIFYSDRFQKPDWFITPSPTDQVDESKGD